jgi:tetratricopeptide (TPR) repeat protein
MPFPDAVLIAVLSLAGAPLPGGDAGERAIPDPASRVPSVATTQTPTQSETLVMPFASPQSDRTLYWLGEGAAMLLADFLERYGAVAVAREERLSAFDRLQLPPAASLSHATMIKVGQFVGAADVVVGSYELAGEHLTVRARVIRLDAGRLTPEVIERGPLSDLFGIFDRAARRLRGASSPAPPAAPGTLLASAPAFELYIKGLVADVPATSRPLLEAAAKAAPADDRVKIALWQVHTDAGNHQRALDAAASVAATSLHARSARYLSALSHIELKRYDEAFATLKGLHAEGRSAEVLNAMGIVQLRRPSTSETGRATYYFNQASQTDAGDPDYFFNLGYAYWLDKDPPAAIYWLREAVRRDPADGDAHFVLAAALQQSGAIAEATRERELALRLSSSYESGRSGAGTGDPVPRGLERLKNRLERSAARVDSIITTSGQRDQAELATFHLDAGRRAFARETDREAERELRRALYLSPYLSEAHLLLGRIHLRTGRIAEAIQEFKIALWSEDTVAGHLALAEAYLAADKVPAAKEEIERALALDPTSAEARALRDKVTVPKGVSMLRSTLESAT